MKIGNRILSVLLCLAMLLSMLPTVVLAQTPSTLADLPTGDVNSLTGANPTTDVALTIDAKAIVVDGTVTDATTGYVLNWNGQTYENMFTYGTNLFATLADAQAVANPGATILVKSLTPAEAGMAITITASAKFYTEAYNTLPYVVGTAFDGSDWTVNEEFAAKSVTIGNLKYVVDDADETDDKNDAGTIALYGFTLNFSGTGVSFAEMTNNRADFIIQNANVTVSGGSPVFNTNDYVQKSNVDGCSLTLKNMYMNGEAGKLFDEWNFDYLTIDGWYVPSSFGNPTANIWYKNSYNAGKTRVTFTNSNFQSWKGWFQLQMCNSKNWFSTRNDATLSDVKTDFDFRPVYITNNIFNNSSLWDGTAFHQVYSNSTSKTRIEGNRIINTGAVIPLLKNNHTVYGNYFTLEMYNNYVSGYASSDNFASALCGPQQGVTPYADIRNNYFSDNTEAKTGIANYIGCTGNVSNNLNATDWYLDEQMTFLNSAADLYYIESLSADNGDGYVYNLTDAKVVVYNMQSGNASSLKFNFKSEDTKATWYSDVACKKPLDASTIKAGDKKTAYVKITIDGRPQSLVYTAHIIKTESYFEKDFVSDDILTNKALLVSNMNNGAVEKVASGQPFEYTLPHNNKTYTFVKNATAFSKISDAMAYAEVNEVVTPEIYFDYSNPTESITLAHSVKIVAPNYNVKPFDDKGFSNSTALSDGTGDNAWTYNKEYDKNKRTVADFNFSGTISPVVEIYGVEITSYLHSSGDYWGSNFKFEKRSSTDAATKFVFQNILVSDAITGIFHFSTKACVEDDSALIKNIYVRSSRKDGQLSFNSNYMPETTVIDGLFMDFNALGTDNKNSTRWYFKQGNSENTFTIKNSNLRNFYNENDPMFNFMGNGESPAAEAGDCRVTFEHNILYNFGTGITSSNKAMFFFTENGVHYKGFTLKDNYITAPSDKSFNLFSVHNNAELKTPITVTLQHNVIKGLAGFGLNRVLSTSSNVRQNYKTSLGQSDNSLSGENIVLEGLNSTVVSHNYYIDHAMKVLSTDVEISDVEFSKGALETDSKNNKFTGISKDEDKATLADFSFTLSDNALYQWYEDSELTLPLKEEDLDKIDMFYAPAFLKVYVEAAPEQYILYTFDIKSTPTPDNLFTETFQDPAGLIDRDKAMLVTKKFSDLSNGAFVSSNFADDTVYSFVKGENAFDTYTEAIEYAKENNISDPHILIYDYTAFEKTSATAFPLAFGQNSIPVSLFTRNYNINPVIAGTKVDGSDWSGNIGKGKGQFDESKSIALSTVTFNTTVPVGGDYKFYGFTITNYIKDGTQRKNNINVEFVNTFFNRPTWNGVNGLVNYNAISGTASTAQKEATETFIMKNTYLKVNNLNANAKFITGTVPSRFVFDTLYADIKTAPAAGLSASDFNCISNTRSFELINCCFVNFNYKGTANTKFLKNALTGKAITKNETSKYIVDGCTFANSSFASISMFRLDFGGLSEVQITNNKIYNKDLNIDLVSSFTTTNPTAVPLKMVVTGNSINKLKNTSTVKRTLTDDSVIADNYFVATFDKAAPETTYGGQTFKFVNGTKTVLDSTSFYEDSTLKYRTDSGIHATFKGDRVQQTSTGAKYLIIENDPVVKDNGDGTYDIDISPITSNPAGNKVEFQIGNQIKELGEVITTEVADPSEITITVIGHALTGSNTATSTLVLSTKLAQVTDVKVGGTSASANGNAYSIVLPTDGADEQIAVTTTATGTKVEIKDENDKDVTKVTLAAGETATYIITASIGDDVKTYTLTVTRESADKTEIVNALEQLIDEVNAELEANGDSWLPGAKLNLMYARSDAYDALDDNAKADVIAQAYSNLALALENAKQSASALESYKAKLANAEAISNKDGKYCAPLFASLTAAISNAKAEIENAVTVDDVQIIIDSLDAAISALKTHKFTNYVHDAGTENCSSNGTMTAKCDTDSCNVKDTKAETKNYKNDKHNFTNYVYNNDATVDADGTETGHCSRCQQEDTRIAEGTMLDFVDSSEMFKDVPAKSWFKGYVDYVATYDLMNGKGDKVFDPNATITRAEFVQVLANMSGVDTSNKKNDTKFKDLKDGAWYVPAVRWAAKNGIVSGTSATTFSPNQAITREQMCVMIVAYADFIGVELNEIVDKFNFKDHKSISSWAVDEVYACQMAGIVSGDGKNFNPKNTAKRCEVAVVISIFHMDYIAY